MLANWPTIGEITHTGNPVVPGTLGPPGPNAEQTKEEPHLGI